jgi:hypothetical protein
MHQLIDRQIIEEHRLIKLTQTMILSLAIFLLIQEFRHPHFYFFYLKGHSHEKKSL